MAENTKIEWCDATVNFWWGCSDVSTGCSNCYAETMDARFHGGDRHWGRNAPRLLRVQEATEEAIRYNRREEPEGRRFRVFANSMGDFFEDRRDLDQPRAEALVAIRMTEHLDWLLLTKRPECIVSLLVRARDLWRAEPSSLASRSMVDWLDRWLAGYTPRNVWLGTSLESQEYFPRIRALLNAPARVHFLSLEPLLGSVDLDLFGAFDRQKLWQMDQAEYAEVAYSFPNLELSGIDWVICGGESGPHARPMHPEWVRLVRDQCATYRVPFFVKQMGGTRDKRGALADIPEDLRIREFPHANP